MFNAPFSFDGRIRRTEYGLSAIAFFVAMFLLQNITEKNASLEILNLLLIPVFWFVVAQGVKRCHDVGRPGWYQVIPFYVFVLLFSNSKQGANEYGLNPKEKVNEVV